MKEANIKEMGHFDHFIARIAGSSDATFAQNTSVGLEKALAHQVVIGLLRTINTAKVTYQQEYCFRLRRLVAESLLAWSSAKTPPGATPKQATPRPRAR